MFATLWPTFPAPVADHRGEGRATREIGEELHMSIKTVETYQAHIKDKLSLRSGRELIQHAMQWRIQEKAS